MSSDTGRDVHLCVYYSMLANAGQRTMKDVPNVSCQVLTSCEAQVTRRKVGAEEALSLLLLGRSVRITSHAIVVRSIFVVLVTIAHMHVLTGGC